MIGPTKMEEALIGFDGSLGKYVPLISTVVNLVNIFIKYCILTKLSKGSIEKSNYLTYINDKTYEDCFILLVPIISNIFFILFDLININWSDKQYVLEAVREEGHYLLYAAVNLKRDKEIVFEAIKQNGSAFGRADARLLRDREFALKVIEQKVNAFCYVDDSLKSERCFILDAVKQNGDLLKNLNESQKMDIEIVVEAVKQNGSAVEYASDFFKNDLKFYLDILLEYKIGRESRENLLKWLQKKDISIYNQLIEKEMQIKMLRTLQKMHTKGFWD